MLQRIKAKLYALCFWQTRWGDLLSKIYDLHLFYKYSFKNIAITDEDNLRSSLIKEYHIIEKGMSLPNPRTGFGSTKIPNLIQKAELFTTKYGDEDNLIQSIKESLAEYLIFNQARGENMTTPYYQSINLFISGIKKGKLGGTKVMLKTEIEDAIRFDYEKFVKQRVSVRDFSSEDLTVEELVRAISIAKNAPSVCNRQSWKAHIYQKNEDIITLLSHQHGNAGFGDSIKALVLITTDIKAFTNLESNQVFIDGGIFSMSLMLALHAQGLGACAMNTCVPYVDEKTIKQLGRIPANERLIMMLGIGKLKDEFKVPISQKKDDNQIIRFH